MWTGADRLYVRTMSEKKVPKELWGKDFFHHWDDGWTACVSVTKMPVNEARKLERKSAGFAGYDWMIRSIVKKGAIEYEGTE